MGNLKPGATYVYERDGHKIYAREAGQTERQLIGYDYDGSGQNIEQGLKRFNEEVLWAEIRATARHNPTLADALRRCVEIYELIRNYER